jgi:hypothetical protein
MATRDLKLEIQKTLDNIPEDILQDVLEYLKLVEGQSNVKIEFYQRIKTILRQDKDLLQRLAQ